MQIICAWCNQPISTSTDPHRPAVISHGICPRCSEMILEESRLQLHEQVQRFGEPILLLDADGVVRDFNPAATTLLDVHPDNLVDRPLKDLFACHLCELVPSHPLTGSAWENCPLNQRIRQTWQDRRATAGRVAVRIPAGVNLPRKDLQVQVRFICDHVMLCLHPGEQGEGCEIQPERAKP